MQRPVEPSMWQLKQFVVANLIFPMASAKTRQILEQAGGKEFIMMSCMF